MTIRNELKGFPKQLWAILAGVLVFMLGSAMVWPYLTIYMVDKLSLPLHQVTLLTSIRSLSGVAATFFAGVFADRFGRRKLVLFPVLGGVFYYFGLIQADKLWQFAALMIFWGVMDVCYPVGVNAMIADMVDDDHRIEAYSLMRIVNNMAYSIGPILGGLLASYSYRSMMTASMISYLIAYIFLHFKVKETLVKTAAGTQKKEQTRFRTVLSDKPYLGAVVCMGIIFTGSTAVFNLLSLYAGQVHAIPENHISIVFTVNALLCVFGQMPAVRLSRKVPPLKLMVYAGIFYAVGISCYAIFASVPWYCLCMAVMTIGEVLMSPTMSTLAARLAPDDARGRYMSILSLAHPLGMAVGPAILGYCYDIFSPDIIWAVGGLFPFIAAIGYFFLNQKYGKSERLRPY